MSNMCENTIDKKKNCEALECSHRHDAIRAFGQEEVAHNKRPRLDDGNSSTMQALQIKDILKQLTLFMDITTLGNFSRVCRHYIKLLPSKENFAKNTLDSATKRLMDKLRAYPYKIGEILLTLLKEESAIMAGGSVLQCITNDTFEASDVDIFLRASDHLPFQQFLANAKSMLRRHFNMDHPESPFHRVPIIDGREYGNVIDVRYLLSLHVGDVHLDFVFVFMNERPTIDLKQLATLEEFVERNFDLSLCKCSFDGKTIKSDHVVDQVKRFGVMKDRYLQHAVQMVVRAGRPHDENHPFIKERREIIEARIEKYTQRGFKIVET